jgi:polar amino acid transport system substrate-binding protein
LALRLRQSLRNASLVPAPTLEVAYEMMRRGQVDAIASQRGRLNALASRHPDTRVLGEGFANGRQAIAVPKHRPAALRFVCRFMEKAKASGEVQRALDAAGLTDETVASPEPC